MEEGGVEVEGFIGEEGGEGSLTVAVGGQDQREGEEEDEEEGDTGGEGWHGCALWELFGECLMSD